MIRLHLYGKAPTRRPWVWMGVLLLAVVWVIWKLLPPPPVDRPASLAQRPLAPAQAVPEERAPAVAAEDKALPSPEIAARPLPEDPAPSEPVPEKQAMSDPAMAAPAADTPSVAVKETDQPRVVVTQSTAPPDARTDPRACLRVLDLADGVGAEVELVMIRGNAAGEFMFEGRANDEAAAKALKQGVPGASMSYWHSQGRLNFTLQGVLRAEKMAQEAPASAAGTVDWQQLARASGLRQLTVEAQPSAGTAVRHKMWGQGSIEQVRRFAASVVGTGGVVWREFVFDAASSGGGRLFVALEAPAP